MIVIRDQTSVEFLKALGYKLESKEKSRWCYVCESKHARIRIGGKKRIRKESTMTGELMEFTFKEFEAAYLLLKDYQYDMVDRARERIMSSKPHLNPCPRCGSENVSYHGNYDGPIAYSGSVKCGDCGFYYYKVDYKEKDFRTKADVVNGWNKRIEYGRERTQ